MRDIAIYFINDGKDNTAYLCQGRLFDYLRGRGYKVSKNNGHGTQRQIETPRGEMITFRREILSCTEDEYVQLLKTGHASISKCGGSNLWSVYKVPDVEEIWGVDRRKSQSAEEAKVYEEKRKTVAEVRQLDTVIIDSITFPLKVYIQRDQKGKLFCRLNLHPEIDGVTSLGKLCFPDRVWTDVAEGDAIINSCTELPTYSFIRGEMVKYTLPPMELFFEWAVKNLKPTDFVFFIKDSPHGDYIGIKDKKTDEYRRLVCIDKKLFTKAFYPIADDMNISTVKYQEVYSIVFDFVFGESKMSLRDFADKIVNQAWSIDVEWNRVTDGSMEDFDDVLCLAISDGLLVCSKNEKHSVYNFSWDLNHLLKLYYFCAEEVDDLIQICNRYNQEAYEKLTSE